MVDSAPLWSVLVAPVLLAALAFTAAVWNAVLSARASGLPVRPGVLSAPVWRTTSLLLQQRRTTLAADALLWRLGGAAVAVAAVLAVLVVPVGGYAVSDLSVGVVWFNAMEVVVW